MSIFASYGGFKQDDYSSCFLFLNSNGGGNTWVTAQKSSSTWLAIRG